MAIVLACQPGDVRGDRERAAVRAALERGDRFAAIVAIEQLEDALPATPEALLELARLRVRAGDAPGAVWDLEAGVRRHPQDDALRLALARAALLTADPRLAREMALAVSEESERYVAALRVRAEAELALGDLETALATLAEAELRDPDHPAAKLARIAALMQDDRNDEARAAIEVLRADLASERGAGEPDDAESRDELLRRLDLTLAQLEAEDGDAEAALAILEPMTTRRPVDTQAWLAWIRGMAKAGRGDEARERVEAAVAEPEPPLPLLVIASDAYRERGEPERAEAALRRYAELSEAPTACLPLVEFVAARGDTETVLRLLAEATARHPDEPALHLLHTEALLGSDPGADARAAFERFRETTFEGDPQIDYLEARFALAAGDAAGAAERLTRLAPQLDRAATHYWLGRALEVQGDREGALRRHATASRRNPGWPPPLAAVASLEAGFGRWPAVAASARRLVQVAPDQIGGWVWWVEALVQLGEGEAAEASARRCAESFPEHAEPQRLLAKALRAQGRTDEALDALERAETLGGEVAAERAWVLGLGGRVREGIAEARAGLESSPDDAALHAALAALLFATGAAEEGAAAVDRALALDPNEPRPLRDRCEFRVATGRFATAMEDCTRYLGERPDDADAHFLLGSAASGLGRDEAAIAAYRRAAQLDERDARSRNNLADLLARRGDLEGALAAAQDAYRLAEDDAHVADTLGALYLRAGRPARAVSLLEEALESSPGLASAQRNLALARAAAERGAAPSQPAPASDAPSSVGTSTLPVPETPNLALIVVDTLRADALGAYGEAHGTSPELDAWAARGVLFERARSQSSWTKISMASLFTSLWPHRHGIREAEDGLGDDAVTLAEVFHEAGYATYGVQTNGWLHQSFGFQQGFDRYSFPKGGGIPALGRPSLWAHADRVYEEAVRLIDAHDAARPFFLYLHFMDVHEYAAPPPFKTFGTDDRGSYLAAVRWVDDTVRRVREKLEASGHAERTVMVLAADHGETFGEHGVHGHARNVLTPVVSVPLILRLPTAIPPVRVETQVRNLDVAPTLLALAGLDVPESFEGRSLLPLFTGMDDTGDRPSFAALGTPLFPDASIQTAVNDGAWTYARNAPAPEPEGGEDDAPNPRFRAVAPGAEFLFERRLDPGENANLVRHEKEQAARLRARLDAHLAESDAGVVEHRTRIDPGIAERLKAMGYLR